MDRYDKKIERTGTTFHSNGMMKSQTADPVAQNKRSSGGGALVLLAGEFASPARYRLRIERFQ
jgi:hypothetical protein